MSEIKTRKPMVYIAGPISSGPIHNAHNAMNWWYKLNATNCILPICPHWGMLQDLLTPLGYESWMEWDLGIICNCDALFRLQGESPGADREVKFAEKQMVDIFYEPDFDTLVQWCRERCEDI